MQDAPAGLLVPNLHGDDSQGMYSVMQLSPVQSLSSSASTAASSEIQGMADEQLSPQATLLAALTAPNPPRERGGYRSEASRQWEHKQETQGDGCPSHQGDPMKSARHAQCQCLGQRLGHKGLALRIGSQLTACQDKTKALRSHPLDHEEAPNVQKRWHLFHQPVNLGAAAGPHEAARKTGDALGDIDQHESPIPLWNPPLRDAVSLQDKEAHQASRRNTPISE
eukprot:CAMPEP_0179119134 /NCGR_PEP_ID=MMETSP0796-20121207/56069_1 /TAXON_ID=73915 /ORGANISM="Pyrodinium bahamense, Strain pbaha01" /LENGTH=223 /DNA_ID=CAMNT_0020817627 /DNA_START=306 /DNA_END=976 /DNA_ORIENTATION=+